MFIHTKFNNTLFFSLYKIHWFLEYLFSTFFHFQLQVYIEKKLEMISSLSLVLLGLSINIYSYVYFEKRDFKNRETISALNYEIQQMSSIPLVPSMHYK